MSVKEEHKRSNEQQGSGGDRSAQRPPRDEGQQPPQCERLIEVYRRVFEVVLADTPMLCEEAYRLRYQVYCVENPFEDPADNPGEMETDDYDERSVHTLLRHRAAGAVAGTVRLVLPSIESPNESFPFHHVCRDPLVNDPTRFPVSVMGEVSRFSISKEFRRRCGDSRYPTNADDGPKHGERRIIPNLTIGLIEGLVRMSLNAGVTHWCAVMEPALLRLLSRFGIYFKPIGALVDYHGKRQPCHQDLETFLTGIYRERKDVWEVVTDDGAHWQTLQRVLASRRYRKTA